MLVSPFQSGIPSGPAGSSFERHRTSVEWLSYLAKLRLISELIGFMNKEKLQISSDILEYQEEFEVIVVDDGHAGFEAALASARIRSKPSIFYFTQQI